MRETRIIAMEVRGERDVVVARQRARLIAEVLRFEALDQVRIATAVSEIARNALSYAGGGTVSFSVEGMPVVKFWITTEDHGPGIANLKEVLSGSFESSTGMGVGITGARRLMDDFEIHSTPGEGTSIRMGKLLKHPDVGNEELGRLGQVLADQARESPLKELIEQNHELMRALEELKSRQEELVRLNRELDDTNRGVVALYAELDERAHFLRRASELKSRFLSDMSHEFRTPLNSILSLAGMLLSQLDGELNSEQQKQVTYIQRAAKTLAELVNDLLDLAKVEAGKVTVYSSEFTVEELFRSLRGMLRPLLLESSVKLIFEDASKLPPLVSDEAKISQILRNYLSNALKFTEHGEIRVSAKLEKDAMVVFCVSDTGIGIAPENHELIFQEFVQVENRLQKKIKGTGLGLPLCRRLAELLHGRVWVESQLGKGAKFCAAIPAVYRGPTEVTYVPEIKRELDPNRTPVLVVEDNREALFIYDKFLNGTGFQVIPARTVAEAEAALRVFRPALVFMDVLLEHENTWDLLSNLKSSPQTKDIPVVVVTQVENESKALDLGADAYYLKPIERKWLLEALRRFVAYPASQAVLIVDDDMVSRYVLRRMLSGTSYEVLEADSGEKAINLARSRKPLAIFLDLIMPEMDGFETYDLLRRDPLTRDIPVVIVSSKTLTDPEQARLSGVAAIFTKDAVSREQMLQIVTELVGRE